jgi:hypothetical protein
LNIILTEPGYRSFAMPNLSRARLKTSRAAWVSPPSGRPGRAAGVQP